MKLHAITRAALSLLFLCPLAHAQQDITIYGAVDAYTGQVRNTGGTGPQGSAGAVNSGGLTTSFIGFRGSEDLGGGLKAVFALESYLRVDTGAIGRNDSDPLWGRLAIVGLDSEYGRVTFGRHVTPYSLAATTTAPAPLSGTTTVSPIFANTYRGNVLGDTRFNNSIRYTSPETRGFQLDVVASLGREAPRGPDYKRDQAIDGSLRYANGPLRLVTATRYIDLNNNNDGHKQNSYMVGGIYDFQVIRLNGQYHYTDESYNLSSRDIKRKTWEIGASVPFGLGAFALSWAKSDIDHHLGPTVSDRRDSWVIAYDYNLSKRTDIYAAFYRDKQKNPEVLQQITAIGLRHLF
jgi:predicted porin